MVPIFALMPTAARLAWMIGAIAIMAGKGRGDRHRGLEAVGDGRPRPAAPWPSRDRRAALEELDVGIAPVPRGNDAAEDRRRLAEEGALRPAPCGRWPRPIAWRTFGLSSGVLVLLRQQPVVARAFERDADEIGIALNGGPVLRRDLVGEVDLARHDRVGQRGDVGDDAVLHRVEIRLARLEVVRVASRT